MNGLELTFEVEQVLQPQGNLNHAMVWCFYLVVLVCDLVIVWFGLSSLSSVLWRETGARCLTRMNNCLKLGIAQLFIK